MFKFKIIYVYRSFVNRRYLYVVTADPFWGTVIVDKYRKNVCI